MPKKKSFRLPDPTNRTIVIGRTGSGKSQLGAWLLSTQGFGWMPWVIVDFKDEDSDIINKIEGVIPIDYNIIPTKPGLYILKPMSGDKELLEEWLWKVYYQTGIGLYFDEVFPLGQRNEAFNTIMMQGRSKYIPVIACTQRPVGVSTYCFTEASFYYVFDLTKVEDRQKVSKEVSIPGNYDLPEYHCYYSDVKGKFLDKLKPVPDEKIILVNIEKKLPPPPRRTL